MADRPPRRTNARLVWVSQAREDSGRDFSSSATSATSEGHADPDETFFDADQAGPCRDGRICRRRRHPDAVAPRACAGRAGGARRRDRGAGARLRAADLQGGGPVERRHPHRAGQRSVLQRLRRGTAPVHQHRRADAGRDAERDHRRHRARMRPYRRRPRTEAPRAARARQDHGHRRRPARRRRDGGGRDRQQPRPRHGGHGACRGRRRIRPARAAPIPAWRRNHRRPLGHHLSQRHASVRRGHAEDLPALPDGAFAIGRAGRSLPHQPSDAAGTHRQPAVAGREEPLSREQGFGFAAAAPRHDARQDRGLHRGPGGDGASVAQEFGHAGEKIRRSAGRLSVRQPELGAEQGRRPDPDAAEEPLFP